MKNFKIGFVIAIIIVSIVVFLNNKHVFKSELSEGEAIKIATRNWINIEEDIITSKYYSNGIGYLFRDTIPIYVIDVFSFTDFENWQGWVLISTQVNGLTGEIRSIEIYSRDPEQVPEKIRDKISCNWC